MSNAIQMDIVKNDRGEEELHIQYDNHTTKVVGIEWFDDKRGAE